MLLVSKFEKEVSGGAGVYNSLISTEGAKEEYS